MHKTTIVTSDDNPLYVGPRRIDSETVTIFANIKSPISAERIILKTNSRRRRSSVWDRGSINWYKKALILFIGLRPLTWSVTVPIRRQFYLSAQGTPTLMMVTISDIKAPLLRTALLVKISLMSLLIVFMVFL